MNDQNKTKGSPFPQLYEIDDTEETQDSIVWPKINPALSKAFMKAAEAVSAVTEAIKLMAHTFREVAKDAQDVIKDPKNRRIVHLAQHAKKERTRKKNFHRLSKLLKETKR